MSEHSEKPFKLPLQIRVLIGIVAFPFLFIVYAVGVIIATQNWPELTPVKLIFCGIAAAIYYVVFTGKVPWIKKKT